MNKKAVITLLLFFLFSDSNQAFANNKNTLGLTTITVSYSDDRLLERYSPMIAKAYLSLGIRPHFEKLTYNRSNRLSQKLEVGAVLIKGEKSVTEALQLVKVDVPLSKYIQALICNPEVPCRHDILDQTGVVIGSANSKEMLDQMLTDKPVQVYQLVSVEMVIAMLKNGRMDYGIAYLREGEEYRFDGLQIASPPLEEDVAYHYLSKKLEPLAIELELALRSL